MQDNKQGLQANPEYTIHYLSQEIMRLTQENAMLKAYIQENKENQQYRKVYFSTNRQRRYRTCSISRFHRKFYNF